MDVFGVIYKIVNKVTGETYIGQTTRSLNKRWQEHCEPNGKSVRLSRAIQKYGAENFTKSIICHANNIEELNKQERLCIRVLNTMHPNGYNLRSGGKNSLLSEETKKKISLAQKGKKASEEAKKKMSIARIGKTSPNKGKKLPKEWRDNISKSNTGKKRLPEVGMKISAAQTGDKNHQFGKIGNKSNRFGIKHSDEAKNLCSKAKDFIKKPILCIETQQEFPSLHAASKALRINVSNLSKVLQGKYKSCGGFTFRYIGKPEVTNVPS